MYIYIYIYTYIRSLTPIILLHSKNEKQKRIRHQKKNDMLSQVSPIGKENDTNTRLITIRYLIFSHYAVALL